MNKQMIEKVYQSITTEIGIHAHKDKGAYLVGTMTMPYDEGVADGFSDPADIPPERGEEGIRLAGEFGVHFTDYYQKVLCEEGESRLNSGDVFALMQSPYNIHKVTGEFLDEFPEVTRLTFGVSPELAASGFINEELNGFDDFNVMKGHFVWVLKWNPEGVTRPYAWSVNLYDYISQKIAHKAN